MASGRGQAQADASGYPNRRPESRNPAWNRVVPPQGFNTLLCFGASAAGNGVNV